MSKHRFLRSVRLLAQCYQAFERLSGRHVRELGLTPAQFDVVATLGNLPGLSFRELGERTLITKGTLTGVVARLETQGIVERLSNPSDRRSTTVRLTAAGERLFDRVFPAHIAHCGQAFADWTPAELDALDVQLERLRGSLSPSTESRARVPGRGSRKEKRHAGTS
jgi:DNA-binding MarR family transcriptional regulator